MKTCRTEVRRQLRKVSRTSYSVVDAFNSRCVVKWPALIGGVWEAREFEDRVVQVSFSLLVYFDEQ